MSMQYRKYDNQQDYVNALVKLISSVEGFANKVYRLNDKKATIGYGYTFNRNNNVDIWTAAGISLTQQDLDTLEEIDNSGLQSERTDIACSHFRRRITKDEATRLLSKTYQEYEGPANDLAIPLSVERVALVAITYNRGEGAVRGKMQDFYEAIAEGNRAEAWFQIRYNSLGSIDEYVNGKAKARYLESQIFGLYYNSLDVSLVESRFAFQMLQRHRDTIKAYENQFGIGFDGTGYAGNVLDRSNSDYRDVLAYFGLEKVDTINGSLNPAKTVLLADLRADSEYSAYPDITERLQDGQIVSTNIYLNPAKDTDSNKNSILDARPYETGNYKVNGADDLMIGLDQRDWMYGGKGNDILLGGDGNDFLDGGAGSDVLYGGSGNDNLYGGGGSDVLIGGSGSDTYYYKYGEGNVRIVDDGQGDRIVIIDDTGDIIKEIKLGNVFQKNEQTNVYTDGTGKIQITHNSPWQIVTEDGGTITLGDDFQSGDFGINLIDVPDTPVTTNTILGDQQQNTYIDHLTDTAASDSINGGQDGDFIDASYGGNDRIFSDTYAEMEDLVEAGETAQGINESGEALSGGAGEDLIYASNYNDLVFGGKNYSTYICSASNKELLYPHAYYLYTKPIYASPSDHDIVSNTGTDRFCRYVS